MNSFPGTSSAFVPPEVNGSLEREDAEAPDSCANDGDMTKTSLARRVSFHFSSPQTTAV